MHLLFFHVRKATGGESACLIIVLPDKQNPQKCRTFIRTRKHTAFMAKIPPANGRWD